MTLRAASATLAGALLVLGAHARGESLLDPVVVTATRTGAASFDLPVAVDAIEASDIARGRPMVNLSETLARVPGVVARNRQNYAQDLQISVRGFGARATFGVRGVRLFQDDIPQTMPDGQGQTGSFQLLSTARIEVLRGPFSTLYGNASGGVIAAFTEPGTPDPEVVIGVGAGSDATSTLNAKWTGTADGVGYVAAASRFDTDGYRAHSAARRDLAVARVAFAAGPRTTITVLASHQNQPESRDPLGLTREQWLADPRQADAAAFLFDTRKTVRQQQGGMRVEHEVDDATTLRFTAYAGRRDVRQYLAFAGAAPTSSGGVTDLDRSFGGASLKVFHRSAIAGRPLRLAAGVDVDLQHERRRGYVNEFGALGALRRDEDDTVRNADVYAQAEIAVHERVTATAGLRASHVRFRVADRFVTAVNPDDSGSVDHRRATPVVGLTWHAADDVNVYATFGDGFETPTFTELAYRTDGPGPNFGLRPATSRAFEVGAKAIVAGRHRIDVAAFRIDTDDEIVVDAATGGRTTYRNATATRRRGVEVGHSGDWGSGVTTRTALTWLDARFSSAFVAGQGGTPVPAGNRLPGVPEWTAYAEAAWVPDGLPWLQLGAELQHVASVYVDDRNSASAPSYTVASLRVGASRAVGRWTVQAFVRSDNVADRDYVGSVIVGDTNGRYYEPAPGRTWFAGASAQVRF